MGWRNWYFRSIPFSVKPLKAVMRPSVFEVLVSSEWYASELLPWKRPFCPFEDLCMTTNTLLGTSLEHQWEDLFRWIIGSVKLLEVLQQSLIGKVIIQRPVRVRKINFASVDVHDHGKICRHIARIVLSGHSSP